MFFFFNDTATTEIYTLSLHDALPIFTAAGFSATAPGWPGEQPTAAQSRTKADIAGLSMQGLVTHYADLLRGMPSQPDRKSTRLNSSHANISYAVFCLKKKKNKHTTNI